MNIKGLKNQFSIQANSPRNHWRSVSHILSCLSNGRLGEAKRALEEIRYSPVIPEAVIHQIAENLGRQAIFPMKYPMDAHRYTNGAVCSPKFNRIGAKRRVLPRYPYEMVLPQITGNLNDFSFIQKVYQTAIDIPNLKDKRLSLMVTYQGDPDEARRHLEYYRASSQYQISNVTLIGPDGLAKGPNVAPGKGPRKLWNIPLTDQLASMGGNAADFVVFLPITALTDPTLMDRIIRLLSIYENACLPLYSKDDVNCEETANGFTSFAETKITDSFCKDRVAWKRLGQLAFATTIKSFADAGGFHDGFRNEAPACIELGYKLHTSGAYFIPMSVKGMAAGSEALPSSYSDRKLLEQLCPHPWIRKETGVFSVPKVSIYIPAYRASKYISAAIDSVLEQDYQDLEVCIADDGSPDDTLKVLEGYAGEHRVRFETGPNGGIGHASNRAIRMARGMYIGQLDSDDRLNAGAVSRMVDYLDANLNVGCVYGSCERIDRSGRVVSNEYSWPAFSREKMMLTSIVHHFRMFRKAAWMRTEGFREDITNAVDYDIFLKLSEVTDLHHIDEVLYQRRWHGENTSHVNEAFQTSNTYRVQREALARTGLSRYWDVSVPDPEAPRLVTYVRHGSKNRVFFWPDYTRSNVYQNLLYGDVSKRAEVLSGDIDAALRAAKEVRSGDGGSITFHLHWLNSLIEKAETAGEAADIANAFIQKLLTFKQCGGRIVWTIHNIVSHDLPFPQVEKELANRIISLADAIHLHSTQSLPEIKRQYDVPENKVKFLRHGSYTDCYPNFINRAQARKELNIDDGDIVILFSGAIRPYKGLGSLLRVFNDLVSLNSSLRLVLAGRGDAKTLFQNENISDLAKARITLHSRFLDQSEFQIFFNAADVSVFPYRNILTSGSALLSLSFGVPVVAPDFGMTREILSEGERGLLYPAQGGDIALKNALNKMLTKVTGSEREAIRLEVSKFAMEYKWQNLDELLFPSH